MSRSLSSGKRKELEKKWKAEMEKYDELIEYAENIGDYEKIFSYSAAAQNRANEIAAYYRSHGYSAKSAAVLGWQNKGYEYSAAADRTYDELFGNLTDSIKDLISSLNSATALQEKTLALQEAEYDRDAAKQAVTKAEEGLENAKKQRNVRIWNEETDSWDFVADASAVSSAEEQLQKRQEELRKAENSLWKAETALNKQSLSNQLEAFTASSGTVLGSDLASLIANALQNHDTAAPAQQSINYYFQNGISIGAKEAETMTLAELAKLLGSLEVY